MRQKQVCSHPEVHHTHKSKEQQGISSLSSLLSAHSFPSPVPLYPPSFCFLQRRDITGFLTHILLASSAAHLHPVTWFIWVTRHTHWTPPIPDLKPFRLIQTIVREDIRISFGHLEGSSLSREPLPYATLRKDWTLSLHKQRFSHAILCTSVYWKLCIKIEPWRCEIVLTDLVLPPYNLVTTHNNMITTSSSSWPTKDKPWQWKERWWLLREAVRQLRKGNSFLLKYKDLKWV